jgi:hypothetical protein
MCAAMIALQVLIGGGPFFALKRGLTPISGPRVHKFLCYIVIALVLAPATWGDGPQWSSPDTQLDMTYVPKVGDQAVIGTPGSSP